MRKLKNNKGFTLVETLACVAILILLSGLCTTGMEFAMTSYKISVFESDSQMLSSTIELYLNDVLRHAKGITTETDGTVISFTNETYHITNAKIGLSEKYSDTNQSYLVYLVYNDKTAENEEILILGKDAYAKTLSIADFELHYDQSLKLFTGSYVIKSGVVDSTRTCEFTCRTILE